MGKLDAIPGLLDRLQALEVFHPPFVAWLKVLLFDEELFGNFSRLLYLDADTLPLGDAIPELFSLPKDVAFACARMPAFTYECHDAPALNTAVMMLRPNASLFRSMLQRLHEAW